MLSPASGMSKKHLGMDDLAALILAQLSECHHSTPLGLFDGLSLYQHCIA